MTYTKNLKEYHKIDAAVNYNRRSFLKFKDHNNKINEFIELFNKQETRNFDIIKFLVDLEFEDEDINKVVQEVMFDSLQDSHYTGSSVLSAYITHLHNHYNDIGVFEHLTDENKEIFTNLSEKDFSDDIDFFFNDIKTAYIFGHVMFTKIQAITKFLEKLKDTVYKNCPSNKLTAHRAFVDCNNSLIRIYGRKPLSDTVINESLLSSLERGKYVNQVKSKDSLIAMKFNLFNDLTSVFDFFTSEAFSEHAIDYRVDGFSLNKANKDLFRNMDTEKICSLNLIGPALGEQLDDRIKQFDFLNCALTYNLLLDRFDTDGMYGDNSHIINVLVKPWEITFNREFFSSNISGCNDGFRDPEGFHHPVYELIEDLNLEVPSTELEKLLLRDYKAPEASNSVQSANFLRGNKKEDLKNRSINRVLIPLKADHLHRTSYPVYDVLSEVPYTGIIESQLARIKKYKEKGFIFEQRSNYISTLAHAKLADALKVLDDNIFELLDDNLEVFNDAKMAQLFMGSRKNNKEAQVLKNNVKLLDRVSETQRLFLKFQREIKDLYTKGGLKIIGNRDSNTEETQVFEL